MNGVHALPKTFMGIDRELLFFCKARQNVLFKVERKRVGKKFKYGRLDDEETAINQCFGLGFFAKPEDERTFHFELSEPPQRMDSRKCHHLPRFFMKREERRDINISDPVTVGKQERFLV